MERSWKLVARSSTSSWPVCRRSLVTMAPGPIFPNANRQGTGTERVLVATDFAWLKVQALAQIPEKWNGDCSKDGS
jgi:hypothetical protein